MTEDQLVEIAAAAIEKADPTLHARYIKRVALVTISAIRHHIEAIERERCARIVDIPMAQALLQFGEMTSGERRLCQAILRWAAAAIRAEPKEENP